jgi:hypothetical protein
MGASSIGKTAGAPQRQARIGVHVASKLIAVMSDSSDRLGRIVAHPMGASWCLALGIRTESSAGWPAGSPGDAMWQFCAVHIRSHLPIRDYRCHPGLSALLGLI